MIDNGFLNNTLKYVYDFFTKKTISSEKYLTKY